MAGVGGRLRVTTGAVISWLLHLMMAHNQNTGRCGTIITAGGLDRMAGDIREGQEKIASSLVLIPLLYKQRPESVLILLFGDAKLHELVDIFRGRSTDETAGLQCDERGLPPHA